MNNTSNTTANPTQSNLGQQTRIVLVDDNAKARSGLKALLSTVRPKAIGRTVQEIRIVGEASNGQEAVRLMEEKQPDVVLMDAQLPVMDGLEATRIIKQRWPEVRVVLLTMYPDYKASAWKAGVDVFLHKGCSTEELIKAILVHSFSDQDEA